MEIRAKCPQCDHDNPEVEINDEGGLVDIWCDHCNCHWVSKIEVYIEQVEDTILEPGEHWDWDDDDDETNWS